MTPASVIVVTWIVVNGVVQLTRAGLSYRTAKRRDHAKGATP